MKRKELRDWGITVLVVAVLYFTGWYRPVMGLLQQGILATGLYRPDISLEQPVAADYSLQIKDAQGNVRSLAEFQGETVLINLWATWCPPCRAELPDMEDLYHTEEGQAIRWIMISRDDDLQKAVDFFEDRQYPWEVYHVVGGIPAAYQSKAIPSTFVLSPQGQIVVHREGMAQYNTRAFRKFLSDLN